MEMNKIKFIYLTVFILISVSLAISPVLAQENELALSLSRDFGYSAGAGEIQGRFSMKVSGPPDLIKVVFYIDDVMLGEDIEAPFRMQFSTEAFPAGRHRMYAVGYTSSGQEIRSRELSAIFITADEAWKKTGSIIVPVLVVVFGAILVSSIVPLLTGRGKREQLAPGQPRNYGFYGGAVCPKCDRPFSMHIYGFNLLTHRFDRCPYCGRWSLVRRAGIDELRAAEQAELEMADAESQPALTDEDRIRKDLDDSRYQDL